MPEGQQWLRCGVSAGTVQARMPLGLSCLWCLIQGHSPSSSPSPFNSSPGLRLLGFCLLNSVSSVATAPPTPPPTPTPFIPPLPIPHCLQALPPPLPRSCLCGPSGVARDPPGERVGHREEPPRAFSCQGSLLWWLRMPGSSYLGTRLPSWLEHRAGPARSSRCASYLPRRRAEAAAPHSPCVPGLTPHSRRREIGRAHV